MSRRAIVAAIGVSALLAGCQMAGVAAGAGAGAGLLGAVQAVSSGVQTAVEVGALFCATATPAGSLVVQIADAANGGKPVNVIDQSAAWVAAVCKALPGGGLPVAPPALPAAAPVVAVVPPPKPVSLTDRPAPA